MISWLYIMQGAGMIFVGAIAIAYWYLRKRTGLKYFLYGGILWAIAIGIKLIMDYTITLPFYDYTRSVLSLTAVIIIMSLYYGLRTGILENLIPFLALKKMSSVLTFDTIMAIGIGFGAAEAIVLGAFNFYDTFTLLQKLDILTLLPPISLDQQSLINVLLPGFERLMTLFIHSFAIALVLYYAKYNNLILLIIAIVYKTIVDGLILPFNYYLGPQATLGIDTYCAILCIAGLAGILWLKKKYGMDKVSVNSVNIAIS